MHFCFRCLCLRIDKTALYLFNNKRFFSLLKRDDLVKIFSLKSDNCALTLRKRLFCNAKPTLLPCKTAAFGMQNNRFCNALITSKLHNSYACEKYLHSYSLIPVHKTRKILSVYGVVKLYYSLSPKLCFSNNVLIFYS